jgi:hypothetical protein
MDMFSTIAPFLLMGVFAFFVIRALPTAIDWVKNGPKGSASEWLNAGLLLAAVAAFVVFLMSLV